MKLFTILTSTTFSHAHSLVMASLCVAMTACVGDYEGETQEENFEATAEIEDALEAAEISAAPSSGQLACGQTGTILTNDGKVKKECTVEAWNTCGRSSVIGNSRLPETQNGNTTDVIVIVQPGATLELVCCGNLDKTQSCGWKSSNCVDVQEP